MELNPASNSPDPRRQPKDDRFVTALVRQEIRLIAAQMQERETVDLSSLALQMGLLELTLPIPEENIAAASLIKAGSCILFCNDRLLIPNGVLSLANTVGKHTFLAEGEIERQHMRDFPCVGGNVWIAPIRWSEMMPNCPGLGVTNWALTDPDVARQDALNMWMLLPALRQRSNIGAALVQHIISLQFTSADYAEKCGYEHIRASVTEVAANNQYCRAFGLPHWGSEDLETRLKLLTKPGSSLRHSYDSFRQDPKWLGDMVALSISHYCSCLRGIRQEVQACISTGDFAGLKLKTLDYVTSEIMRAGADTETPSHISVDSLSARHFNSGLAELGFRDDRDVALAFQQPGESGATVIRQVFDAIYNLDFRSDTERKDLLSNPHTLR